MSRYYYIIGRKDLIYKLQFLGIMAFLIAAAILIYHKKMLGFFCIGFGAIIAALYFNGGLAFREQIRRIKDKDEFRRQLESPSSLYFKEFTMTILEDYLIVEKPELRIHPYTDFVGVTLKNGGRDNLYLVLESANGWSGTVAEADIGTEAEEDLMEVYELLSAKYDG